MVNDSIPEEIREFIFNYIDSVELLEVLLLLRQNPEKMWTYQKVSDELRTSPISIASRIKYLKSKSLVSIKHSDNEDTFKYETDDVELDRRLSELAHFYSERRVSVIELIFSRPTQKIQTFAEAFKLRKD